jgi:hypothetical protein
MSNLFRMKKKKLIICALATLSLPAFGEEYMRYSVKKGSNISYILFDLGVCPIYGKHGALNKVVEINIKKVKNNGNFVLEDTEILVPKRVLPLRKLASEDSPQVIIPTPLSVTAEPEMSEGPIALTPPAPVAVEKKRVVEPPPVPAPVAIVPEPKAEPEPDQYTYLRISPQVSWMKIVSEATSKYTTSDISALSKANPGLLVNYGMTWDESTKIYGFGYVSQVNLYSDEQYNIVKKSFLRKAFGVGFEYNISSNKTIGARAGFFDEFFLTMPSAKNIDVEIAQIPEFNVSYRHKFLERKKMSLSYAILGKLIVPYSSANVQGKLGYGVGADLMIGFDKKAIRVFYNASQAKADGKSTNAYEIGWNFVFETRFLEN